MILLKIEILTNIVKFIFKKVPVQMKATTINIITVIFCLSTFNCNPATDGSDDDDDNTPFITVKAGNFMSNNTPFRFAGTNAYYLPNYQKLDQGVVERALDLFKDTGVNVVRMWAFYDGYDCGYSKNDDNENVIQTAPGAYNESALRDLDKVIAMGKERGIRFILPFVNYWNELGGICQYNKWAGAKNPENNLEFFITNEETQKWFKDYITMLLNRVNTVTGVAYKDEPAIFSWQIINEARNQGGDPEMLRDWYQEMAKFIKSIDPNHLVGTGEEGLDHNTPGQYSVDQYSNTYVLRANEGTSYILNTSIPEIDYGNAHWYATEYGFNDVESIIRSQKAWVNDHKKIANELNKPFILGEYGYPGWGNEASRTIYKKLWEYAEEVSLDGSMLWQLTADHVKCYEFGGNICWPEARKDKEMYVNFLNHVHYIKSSE